MPGPTYTSAIEARVAAEGSREFLRETLARPQVPAKRIDVRRSFEPSWELCTIGVFKGDTRSSDYISFGFGCLSVTYHSKGMLEQLLSGVAKCFDEFDVFWLLLCFHVSA